MNYEYFYGGDDQTQLQNNQVVSNLVIAFRKRAQGYFCISVCLLQLTILIIVIGALTFVFGDRTNEILSQTEVEALKDLSLKQSELDKIDSYLPELEEAESTYSKSVDLASFLFHSIEGIKQLKMKPTAELLRSFHKTIQEAVPVVTVINNIDEEKVEGQIKIPGSPSQGAIKVRPRSIYNLRDAATAENIDTKKLEIVLQDISKMLEAWKTEVNYDEDKARKLVEQIEIKLRDFSKLTELYHEIYGEFKKAESSFQDERENKIANNAKRSKLEKEIEQLRESVDEARKSRDSILFMAWIPGLTLRFGIVIMLLFLTQILLSTYRFTASLSTFYLAKADALKLVQAELSNNQNYAFSQLSVLCETLTPSKYQMDPVQDPASQLTEVVKTWAAKSK